MARTDLPADAWTPIAGDPTHPTLIVTRDRTPIAIETGVAPIADPASVSDCVWIYAGESFTVPAGLDAVLQPVEAGVASFVRHVRGQK